VSGARSITSYGDLRRAEKECAREDVVETNVGFLLALSRNADGRDVLAKAAMQGLCANPGGPFQANGHNGWAIVNCTVDDIANTAYDIADAMLKARDAKATGAAS
jgi:hypothetical protein